MPPPRVLAKPIPLQLNHHLGLLVFSDALNALQAGGDAAPQAGPGTCGAATMMSRQWLSQLLLGAVNIEQSKLLNTGHLGVMLGFRPHKDLGRQRQCLWEIATGEVARELLRANARHVGARGQSDFLLDPHTKHYTGEKNVLKGWCPAIGHAGKAMHSDFIHSTAGHPLYFETTDNYLDLRERIFPLLDRFRTELEFGAATPMTFVIDRGIFSAEIFARFAERPDLHLVTWDKDYRKDGWDAGRPAGGEFVFERTRNHSQDLRPYHFSWQEHSWDKDRRMRRLIVRATNPRGRSIEVAVLTDAPDRAAQEIILLIFRRWVQENDFKYLDKHFGIDQVTSYQATPYERLAGELADKEMLSTTHRALTKQRREETAKLKVLLLKRERSQRRQTRRAGEIAALEAQLEELLAKRPDKQPDKQPDRQPGQPEPPGPAGGGWSAGHASRLRKRLGGQRGQQKRAAGNVARWEKEIGQQHAKIEDIGRQLAETGEHQSRIGHLIEQRAEKMKGEPKRLMDALRILARNLFYIMLGPFKESYDNYRDDHVIFRSLTGSGGTIEADENEVRCRLVLTPDYPSAIRRHLEAYLEQWHDRVPLFPDGSGRPIRIELTTAAGIQLAPHKT